MDLATHLAASHPTNRYQNHRLYLAKYRHTARNANHAECAFLLHEFELLSSAMTIVWSLQTNVTKEAGEKSCDVSIVQVQRHQNTNSSPSLNPITHTQTMSNWFDKDSYQQSKSKSSLKINIYIYPFDLNVELHHLNRFWCFLNPLNSEIFSLNLILKTLNLLQYMQNYNHIL